MPSFEHGKAAKKMSPSPRCEMPAYSKIPGSPTERWISKFLLSRAFSKAPWHEGDRTSMWDSQSISPPALPPASQQWATQKSFLEDLGYFSFPVAVSQRASKTNKSCFKNGWMSQNSYFQFYQWDEKTIEHKEILPSKKFITTRTPRSQQKLLLLGLILFIKHGKSSNILSLCEKMLPMKLVIFAVSPLPFPGLGLATPKPCFPAAYPLFSPHLASSYPSLLVPKPHYQTCARSGQHSRKCWTISGNCRAAEIQPSLPTW